MSATTFFQRIAGKVDRNAGTITGVSVVSIGEARTHGLLVDRTTLEQVKTAAEQFSNGVKVKLDHETGVGEIVGSLRNFRIEGESLRADLHLLKSHPDFSFLLDLASEIPDTFGLSIAFSGVTEERDGKVYARCSELYSVDLVSEPAANPSGLFEQVKAVDTTAPAEMSTPIETKPAETKPAETPKDVVVELKADTEQFSTALENLKTQVGELREELKKLNAEREELQKQVANTDKVASAKAKEIVASLGVPPVAISVKTEPISTKPDLSTLKGLEKVKAAFELQLKKGK